MSTFSSYQIDFSAEAAGKRVASTKRRIRWRFGYPNEEALASGQTGLGCRGEEHDVVVVWSVTSGKRQISMDSREVHYSTNRAGVLDFSWTSKGNHVMKVICHASPPLSAVPGYKQYDLLIDGQSFFSMPKVFEIGIKGPLSSEAPVPGYSPGRSRSNGYNTITSPATRDQEEEELQRAIQASLEESRKHFESRDNASTRSTPQANTADLLNFSAPALPSVNPPVDTASVASMPSYYSAPPTYSQGAAYQSPPPIQQANPVASPPVSAGALVPAVAPQGYYAAPPAAASAYVTPSPSLPAYASPPAAGGVYSSPPPLPPVPAPTPASVAPGPGLLDTPTNEVFGMNSPPGEDPFAPKGAGPPSHNDLANAILGAYTSPTASSQGTPGAASQLSPGQQQQQTPQSFSLAPANPVATNALVNAKEEPANELEAALGRLVNVDQIDVPASAMRLTMMQEEEKKKKRPSGKSQPLPPVAHNIVGANATLSQIKQVYPNGSPKADPDKIMKAPPPGLFQQGAAYSGALVVHGQGPPPLHQPMGFGVGASMPNGGFSNTPQGQPGYMQQQPQYR